MRHQWKLRRNYQFPNAASTIQEGDGTTFFGWAVNVVLNPGKLYGVVHYVVDGDRVAWKESETHFGTDKAAAETWVKQTIEEIKETQAKDEERLRALAEITHIAEDAGLYD